MRIAQIAPLYESCPPRLYGGTERVVSFLTEELVRMGHEVTLFASGDSRTKARLVAGCPRALRLDTDVIDPLAHHMIHLNQVLHEASHYDILHFHTDYLHFLAFASSAYPLVTTLHGRLDLPDLVPLYRAFNSTPLVSISHDQRTPLPNARWAKTVQHGLPRDLFSAGPGDGGYLAFIGRVSPEKRLDRAILLAREIGLPLKVAAKVDRADQVYFREIIEPLLTEPGVEFIGEINDAQKQGFLGGAKALLFPIDWPEPFGLVMIEAMACGTPVLAFGGGSVPEIIDDGLTGMIVGSMEEAHSALPGVLALDRRAVRARFEERFTADRMARDYVALYEALTKPAITILQERLPEIVNGANDLYPEIGLPAARTATGIA